MTLKPTSRLFLRLLLSCLSALSVLFLNSCHHNEKKYRIGVSQCSQDDWRNKMNEEIRREIMFHNNAEVEIRSAYDSNAKQIEDIRYFADNNFDIIIAAPNEAEAITPVIDEVMAKNIPVLIFDRNVTGDNYTAFQGADNDSIGVLAAKYAGHLTGGRGKVIEIYGLPGSTPAMGRHAGFVRTLNTMPDLNLVATGYGNWNDTRAAVVADSLLRLHPDTRLIYAHNDRMAIAAANVAKKLNLHPYIIGVDAAPQIGMKAVSDGVIDATFLYPTDGYGLVRTALNIVEGKPFEKVNKIPTSSAVDKSNADILILQNESLKEETSKIEILKQRVDEYWNHHSAQTALLYAFIIIAVLLTLSLVLFLRSFWQKKQQQNLLEKKNHELEAQRDTERMLNDKLQTTTQAKLVFFTNVSHDLRTPLTLIAEPIDQLIQAGNLTPQQTTLVKIANKNIKILQRLINQILDFRKYENDKLELNLTEVDIARLIEDWTEAFIPAAKKRHMKISLDLPADCDATMAIDVEKIERVFFNLISNALKYTPDNGNVNVKVRCDNDSLILSVSDTGRGIGKEDLENIFDRFYQVDKIRPNGSGIGLSLAKAFVELHDGTMTVESELGKGSVFTVSIPVKHVSEQAVTTESHITATSISNELDTITDDRLSALADIPENANDDKPLLLAIDDNLDILTMLTTILSEKYRVITASNGVDGVRMAAKYVPDLVICDVMMPQMDGMECCRRIKSEVSTSHIPVLMLTACSMDEQRVQGYECGADGYVSKPFNSRVLIARCENLIKNRNLIKDLWQKKDLAVADNDKSSNSPTERISKKSIPAPNGIDNEFYNRFLTLFRQQISNSEINVDSMAADLGLGRSQFYRKIKALTNFSPVELIRNLRLKEARNRLLTTEQTISEIAYGVGFSTPAYFTKCYREAYGETPSDTRTNLTAH